MEENSKAAQYMALITLVVRDYDEAIDFFAKKLNFELVEDTPLSETKRWVVVTPGAGHCRLLLAKATDDSQRAAVGNQTGGRVAFFLYTDDFEATYNSLLQHKIEIVRPPKAEPYGKVLVFKDLYGNLWDLIGR